MDPVALVGVALAGVAIGAAVATVVSTGRQRTQSARLVAEAVSRGVNPDELAVDGRQGDPGLAAVRSALTLADERQHDAVLVRQAQQVRQAIDPQRGLVRPVSPPIRTGAKTQTRDPEPRSPKIDRFHLSLLSNCASPPVDRCWPAVAAPGPTHAALLAPDNMRPPVAFRSMGRDLAIPKEQQHPRGRLPDYHYGLL